MYCLIQFYVQLRLDLAAHSPFLKVVAIKLVIFLSFWQTVSEYDITFSDCTILMSTCSSSYLLLPPLASSRHLVAYKRPISKSAFPQCFSALKWRFSASFTCGHSHGMFTMCGALRSWPQNPSQASFQIRRRLTMADLLAAKLSWTLLTLGTSSKQ